MFKCKDERIDKGVMLIVAYKKIFYTMVKFWVFNFETSMEVKIADNKTVSD